MIGAPVCHCLQTSVLHHMLGYHDNSTIVMYGTQEPSKWFNQD